MRYPKGLEKGKTIGVIAPSFGATTEPYITRTKAAIRHFRAKSYHVLMGDNCYKNCGIGKSNTAKACANELMDFFTNEKSDVIISCGGGETMCEDMSYVDFAKLGAVRPTWYMGFSDNTNFILPYVTLSDTAAIYGPCMGSFGRKGRHQSLADAERALCCSAGDVFTVNNYKGWEAPEEADTASLPVSGTTTVATEADTGVTVVAANAAGDEGTTPIVVPEEDPLEGYHINRKFSLKKLNCPEGPKTTFSGRLLGGCIDCLSILCGTPYDGVRAFNERYKNDGVVWVLEACDLNPVVLRRSLWQLRSAGWFDSAKGFLIGRPRLYGDTAFGCTHLDAVRDMLGDMNVPILADLDIGHLPPMMPLIMGSYADIESGDNDITISMSLR